MHLNGDGRMTGSCRLSDDASTTCLHLFDDSCRDGAGTFCRCRANSVFPTGNCEMKNYLNLVVNDQSVSKMLNIRTGNHTLSVEIDRYRNRKTYEECICKSCDEEKIEIYITS